MKTAWRSAVKIAAFLMILVLLLYSINSVLLPKYNLSNNIHWPTTSTVRTFYTMDRNTVDVLFLGSSYCVNGFCPQEIYDLYGIRSYNLGTEQQSVLLSYYWLKEALQYQRPSVVVLEGRFMREFHPDTPINTDEAFVRKALDHMRLGPVKLEAVKAVCNLDKKQQAESWFLTNIRFHDRWKSLSQVDFDLGEDTPAPRKGWAPGDANKRSEYTPLVDSDPEAVASFLPVMTDYFGRIADLCKENEIRLVLVNMPGNMTPSLYHGYQKLCRDHGADYIELSEESVWNELGVEFPREDPVFHGNIWGDLRVSRYIGKILSEKYQVPPVQDPQYEESRPYFEHVKAAYHLEEVTDPDEYLSLVKDPRFAVFVSVGSNANRTMPDSTRTLLKDLGFTYEFGTKDNEHEKFNGVITDEGITEEAGEELRLYGYLRDHSSSWWMMNLGDDETEDTFTVVSIDGKDYPYEAKGLSLLVYDLVTRKVVHTASFDCR